MLMTTQQEYNAIREAIQRLTTLDAEGNSRNVVSISIEGFTVSYSSSHLSELTKRERELARRLAVRDLRKRVCG